MKFSPVFWTLVILLSLSGTKVEGRKIKVKQEKESREVFAIEEFGLVKGGYIKVEVKSYDVIGKDEESKDEFIGFVIVRTETEGSALEVLRKERMHYGSEGEESVCPYQGEAEESQIRLEFKEGNTTSLVWEHELNGLDDEGLYSVIFVRCSNSGIVSFSLESTMYNAGPNYLSAGDAPLPKVYFLFTVAFSLAMFFWIKHLRKQPSALHNIHHMMSVLILLKTLSLFFRAIDLHYVKVTGYAFGWNLVYYFFVTLNGISFFTVLLMIGSGWTLLKPTLNEWEMKVLLFVLPLQLFANLALIVDDEITKGSQRWFRWRDLFLLVDILCVVAVVLPVFWQIKFLKQAASVDGKAHLNLQKLKQFQTFYVQLIAYMYFTRIIVFLMGTTLPFHMTYWQAVLKELATLAFFILTGYRFRPAADNAYLRVAGEDIDDPDGDIFFDEFDTDFGLDDSEFTEQELVPTNLAQSKVAKA
mmetsp:Transcript_10798/g.14079  ORF Transcript_10798/g.14079 Transcript_10798/m.14079 type:complete len:472 (-) Transcript_10798:76-1491(-)